jgi:hypothetical protein
MKTVLFVGSPRATSNTRSMAAFLSARLKERGVPFVVLNAKRATLTEAFIAQSIDAIRDADALILMAPVYLDLPPHVALDWMRAIWERRADLDGTAPAVYAISHSGYFDPIHKAVSFEAFEHFARRMDWTWKGTLGFGGTSPIAGKPLEEAGPFAAKVRPALERLSILISEDRPIPSDLARTAERRPIPLPKRWIVWLMNVYLRRASKRAANR